MSAFMPPWPPWYSSRSRGAVPDSQMRVSDAERSEIAENLSKHYSEGRLDEAEFNERLQKAMSAKTRGELAGLLSDLPPTIPPPPPELEARRRHSRLALLVVVALFFAMAVTSAMWTWHFPWLLFAVMFFLIWRMSHRNWYRRHGWGPPPTPSVGSGPSGSQAQYYGRDRGRWL